MPRYTLIVVINTDRPDHRRVVFHDFMSAAAAGEASAVINGFDKMTATVVEDEDGTETD